MAVEILKKDQVGTIALHKVVIFVWLCVYITISFMDLSAIFGTINFDSDNIMQIASSLNRDGLDSAYYNTALFFSYIPGSMLQAFILLVGCIVLTLFMKDLRGITTLGIAAFLSIPAILFILVRPQKETIVALISIVILKIFYSQQSMVRKIILSLVIYGFYGLFFRQYYFIIMAVFISLLVLIYVKGHLKFLPLALLPPFLLAVPSSVYLEIQGARDRVNELRIVIGDAGSRTAFKNLFYPDNVLSFIENYFYAFFKLNFAPLFHFGARELFLFGNVSLYGYFIYKGIKAHHPITVLCSTLLLSHAMVYWIFEPDLGSYLRHLSSVMLYLVPMLVIFDRNAYEK